MMFLWLGWACTGPISPLAPPPIAHAEVPAPAPSPEPAPEPAPELLSPDGVEMVACPGEVVGMACIPGGAFTRGAAEEHTCAQGENRRAGTHFGPAVEIWQQTFFMDLTEVTYGEYQHCVADGLCPPSRPAYNDYDRERQPMVGMTWSAAQAFCAAEGKHIPTEAELEALTPKAWAAECGENAA